MNIKVVTIVKKKETKRLRSKTWKSIASWAIPFD